MCTKCTATARTILLQMPALLVELHRTTARGDQITDAGNATPADADDASVRLPWNEHAAHAAENLERTGRRIALRLARHLRELCTHPSCHGRGHGPRCAAWEPGIVAARYPWAYLSTHLPQLRMTPMAPWALDDIDRHARAGWAAIDRPEDRYYAGPCGSQPLEPLAPPCPVVLWATADQTVITCPRCRTRWDVAQRRTWLLAAARDVTAPAGEIASALTIMTRRRVAATTIRSWAHRGQLRRADDPPGPRPLYRVGDVLDLLDLDPPAPAAPALALTLAFGAAATITHPEQPT